MTTRPLGAARVGELLRNHGIVPKRSLGQNFVVDPNTIGKVVDAAALEPSDRVLEVGAGCGSLTVGLAGACEQVYALEVDRRLLPVLQEVVGDLDNVDIVSADALAADLGGFAANKLIANLPYNIAATMVLRALETAPQLESLTVMTQKEVGRRLAAAPGSKIYGQTSVLVAYFGSARVVAPVSRRAFYPVPKVDSVIVRIDRIRQETRVDREKLFAVVRGAFGQRRKTIRNALITVAGSNAEAEKALQIAGVEPRARAEELDLDQFVAIAEALQ